MNGMSYSLMTWCTSMVTVIDLHYSYRLCDSNADYIQVADYTGLSSLIMTVQLPILTGH